MKRFFEYLGIAVIILFSFFYTEKAALFVQSKSPIMADIKTIEDKEKSEPVNAEINGNTIVPGLYGLEVNAEDSFLKMKEFGVFNRYYLVYNQIKPKISLEDHKDKIIIKGNKSKKAVALIINKNKNVIAFLNQKNIFANELVYEDNLDITFEPINAESEKTKFDNVESLLNKEKINTNICLVNSANKNLCIKNKNYLVKETNELNSTNIVAVKKNIEKGSIILISETAKIEDVNILLKQIEYQDLSIIKLSELIKEK